MYCLWSPSFIPTYSGRASQFGARRPGLFCLRLLDEFGGALDQIGFQVGPVSCFPRRTLTWTQTDQEAQTQCHLDDSSLRGCPLVLAISCLLAVGHALGLAPQLFLPFLWALPYSPGNLLLCLSWIVLRSFSLMNHINREEFYFFFLFNCGKIFIA